MVFLQTSYRTDLTLIDDLTFRRETQNSTPISIPERNRSLTLLTLVVKNEFYRYHDNRKLTTNAK